MMEIQSTNLEYIELETELDVQAYLDYAKEYQLKPTRKKYVNNNLTFQCDDLQVIDIKVQNFTKLPEKLKTSFNAWLNGDAAQDAILYGKMPTERIVSCEVKDANIELFIENLDGTLEVKVIPNKYWIMSPKSYGGEFVPLLGNLHYKYIKYFDTAEEYQDAKRASYKYDTFKIHDPKEAAMVTNGFTYFKGMKPSELSVLSFDIETTSLDPRDKNAKVLLISNTFRKNGKIERRLFAYDEFGSEAAMYEEWSKWVREVDPSLLIGYNIYSFDLPYMQARAEELGVALSIGRDGSNLTFNDYDSKFRKDQAQDIIYKRCYVYGRELVDIFFLTIRYDQASKKYDNYKLKNIIKQEGLEKENRAFYDAGKIRFTYTDPVEWVKIKAYCEDDSDDSLALYDLMIPSLFYSTQMVPKPLQAMAASATGSQVNSMMVRAYLQEGHSLPKASPDIEFEGAISLGNPGIYTNCFKLDVSSLYPSIMRQYEVHDETKDPKRYFLKIVDTLTLDRLKDKQKAKETGDPYYKDLEQTKKIFINSAYGFLAASGLIFNSPRKAEFITMKGREILNKSIDWSKAKGFQLVNADTDSITITDNGNELSEAKQAELLTELNSMFPEKIKFEHDGYFERILVIKSKNYVLRAKGKPLKIKGSALKATLKEPALKEFLNRMIIGLIDLKTKPELEAIYHEYVKEIKSLSDISRWASKKSVTQNVINGTRTNETRVMDAIEGTEYTQGDKIHLYFRLDGTLGLVENWNQDEDPDRLFKKLYDTLKTFETVINVKEFINYSLKRSRSLLAAF